MSILSDDGLNPNNSNSRIIAGVSGHQITNSLRFDGKNALTTLSRTPIIAGDVHKMTFATWVKVCQLANPGSGTMPILSVFRHAINSNDILGMIGRNGSISSYGFGYDFDVPAGPNYNAHTNAAIMDRSAWRHVAWAIDTTQTIDSNRIKIYMNGIQIPLTQQQLGHIVQNYNLYFNKTQLHVIGRAATGDSSIDAFDGNIADTYLIDGMQLDPLGNFIKFDPNGIIMPTIYTGTYGINGFHLEYKNAYNLGMDTSGNNNHWVSNGIASTHQSVDSPTNNYCTMNSIAVTKYTSVNQSYLTFANGNLKISRGITWGNAVGSVPMSENGSYFEVTTFDNGGGYGEYGINNADLLSSDMGNHPTYSYDAYDGSIKYQPPTDQIGPTTLASAQAFGFGATGLVIGVAYKNGKLYFRINGQWVNNANPDSETGYVVSGLSGKTWLPAISLHTAGATVNFGQTPFVYAAPVGFSGVCVNNRPNVDIPKSDMYFTSPIWTGTGNTHTVVIDFTPDILLSTSRSGHSAVICNSTNGAGKNIVLPSSAALVSNPTGLVSFNTNGITLGSDSSGSFNNNGTVYSGAMWKKCPLSGVDVVAFTQTSPETVIPHDLNKIPTVMLVGDNSGGQLTIYHASLGTGLPKDWALYMSRSPPNNSVNLWGASGPSATQFTITSNVVGIGHAGTALLFTDIPGFSKSGIYNGMNDDVFIYTDFQPEFIMIHSLGNGYEWNTSHGSIDTYNPCVSNVILNQNWPDTWLLSGASWISLLSNGFVVFPNGGGQSNSSSYKFVYLAFAKHPFGGANVNPCPAR